MALKRNENKVKFGLKRVAFAIATIAEDGSATYGEPITFPGARTLSMEPQGAGEPWYADDGVYYYNSAPASRQGDLEMARIIDTFKRQVLGYITDANGILLEDMNPAEVHFALLFETMNDRRPRRYVLYNCMATAPTVGSATNEGSKEPQTETSTIMSTGIYVASHDKWFDHAETTPRTDPEAYANWFNSVQLPGAPADPNPVKTKTGAVVSITDGAEDMAVEGLTVAIDTETGVTGATITRSGKNLIPWPALDRASQNGINAQILSNGKLSLSGTATNTVSGLYNGANADDYGTMPLGPFPAGTYTITSRGFVGASADDYILINAKYADGTPVVTQFRISAAGGAIPSGEGYKVTFTANAAFKMFVYIRIASGTTMDCAVELQMERGSALGAWKPYAGQTYAFDWTASPGAITEGTLDAVSGTMTTGGETYNLTPAEITTLHGDNVIYADCGDVTVAYHSDPNLDFE